MGATVPTLHVLVELKDGKSSDDLIHGSDYLSYWKEQLDLGLWQYQAPSGEIGETYLIEWKDGAEARVILESVFMR